MHPWFGGRLMVSCAEGVFDADGNLMDASLRERLQKFVHEFVEFARAG